MEVVKTQATSPEAIATAVKLANEQRLTTIVVRDGAGYYTSRALGAMVREAAYMVQEGVSVELIDDAMRRWGWPRGPLSLVDMIGLDVVHQVTQTLGQAYGGRMQSPATLGTMVADNRMGYKTGSGFYVYNGSGTANGVGASPDATIYELLGVEPNRAMAAEQIQMRCTLQVVNESILCLDDGVLMRAEDGDVGAVLGLGFPVFRGGPFRFADAIGVREVLRRMEKYYDRFGDRWKPAPGLVRMVEKGESFY